MLLKEMFLELSWCDLKQEMNLLRVLSTGVHVSSETERKNMANFKTRGTNSRVRNEESE